MAPSSTSALPLTANSNMSKPVTIRKLALAANVSIGTVSRALKGQSGLSEQTRGEILKLAADMGYDLGKLRSTRPRRILFVYNRELSSLATNPYYSHVLHGAETACREQAVDLSVLSVAPGEAVAPQVRRGGADAILAAGHFDAGTMQALRGCDLPMVLVAHFHPGIHCVNDDSIYGARAMTEHLLAQGAKRLAFIGGPLANHSVAQRLKGFRQALFAAGRLADPTLEVELDATIDYGEAGRKAMRGLLALPQPPDAIFAYNDQTALRALEACVDAGLSVPQDVLIAGYDDIDDAARSQPALTTIRVDKERLCREAVLQLLDGRVEPGETLLPVDLVVRDSTVRART